MLQRVYSEFLKEHHNCDDTWANTITQEHIRSLKDHNDRVWQEYEAEIIKCIMNGQPSCLFHMKDKFADDFRGAIRHMVDAELKETVKDPTNLYNDFVLDNVLVPSSYKLVHI